MKSILLSCLSLLNFSTPPTGFDQWRVNRIVYLKEVIRLDTAEINRVQRKISRLTKDSVYAVNILQARIARYSIQNDKKFLMRWYQAVQNQLDQLPQKKGWREWTHKLDQRTFEDLSRFLRLPIPQQLQTTFTEPHALDAPTHLNAIYDLLKSTLPYNQPKYRAYRRDNYIFANPQKILKAYPKIALAIERLLYEVSEDHRSQIYRYSLELEKNLDQMDLIWGEVTLAQVGHLRMELSVDKLALLLERILIDLKMYAETSLLPQKPLFEKASLEK